MKLKTGHQCGESVAGASEKENVSASQRNREKMAKRNSSVKMTAGGISGLAEKYCGGWRQCSVLPNRQQYSVA